MYATNWLVLALPIGDTAPYRLAARHLRGGVTWKLPNCTAFCSLRTSRRGAGSPSKLPHPNFRGGTSISGGLAETPVEGVHDR